MWATDATAATGTLSWDQTLLAVVIIAVAMLSVGAILIWARVAMRTPGPGNSIVRSWIALALVIGLVLFSVFSFAVDDSALRSTLIGGMTASVGAAVTFYFQGKSSQDLVDAATGTETVPNLVGTNQTDAETAMAKTSLKMETDPAHAPQNTAATITDQMPPANTTVRKGTSVMVRY